MQSARYWSWETITLQCLAPMLEIDGNQGSIFTAKTGILNVTFLFFLLKAICLGMALALSIAEFISLSEYFLDINMSLNSVSLISLLSGLVHVLMIPNASEKGIFFVTEVG